MTQPAFSRRIHALEQWIGSELFDRAVQPVALTATGEWFVKVADDLLARVFKIPDDARLISEDASNRLTFASTHSLSFTFLPLWLRTMEERTPIGPVHIVSDLFRRCEKLILEEQVQFLLSYGRHGGSGDRSAGPLRSVTVGHDTLLCVSGTGANRAPLFTIDQAGDSPAPYLAYSEGSGIGQIVRAAMAGSTVLNGAQPAYRADLATVLRSMAIAGKGLAWLPQSLIAADLETGKLARAGAECWDIPVEINLSRGIAQLPGPAETFWACASS